MKMKEADEIYLGIEKILSSKDNGFYSSKIYKEFKEVWNKHKYSRLAFGLALSGGTIIAAASGAALIAGSLIATRAAISAIGGFIATDAIFDIIDDRINEDSPDKLLNEYYLNKDENIKKEIITKYLKRVGDLSKDEIIVKIKEYEKKKKLKSMKKFGFSAILGTTLGMIGGAKITNVAENLPLKEAGQLFSGKIDSIIGSPKISKGLISEVLDDIKHDHPKQGYITLEQSVRRIEGLKNGIQLNESEKLTDMNNRIATIIRKPGSNIIKSMEELGFLKSGDNFDKVAKKLTEEKIAKIVENAYSSEYLIPSGNNASGAGEEILNGCSIIDKGKLTLGSTLLGGAIMSLVKGKKETNKMKGDRRTKLSGNTESNISKNTEVEVHKASVETKQEVSKERTETTYTETKEDISHKDRLKTVAIELDKILGFKIAKIGKKDEKNISIFSKQISGGCFIAAYTDYENKGEIAMIWYDNSIMKSHMKIRLNTDIGAEAFKSDMNLAIEKLIEEIFLERDRIKNVELANKLRKIKISKADLASIYESLEHPEVLKKGLETGGYWFQDIYCLNDGILELKHLFNPQFHEMDLSYGSFNIKNSALDSYNLRNRLCSLGQDFDEYEINLIGKMLNKYQKIGIKNILCGANMDINWHKHPGYLSHPSIGDINSPDSAKKSFDSNPHQMTITWGIVNKLPPDANESNKSCNSIILRGDSYSGMNDYIIYFWRMNRKDSNQYEIEDLIPINAELT